MHFGENQLSRSLIGLSPLPTGHPPSFQPRWVRSSTRSYPRFNLPMGRSLRFGSRARDYTALFRLAFATAPPRGLTSPHPRSRRLIVQKARRHPSRLRRIVSTRFQVLFHSPPGYFSPFPHGTNPLSVIRKYLGLPRGRGRFTRDFTGPVLLGNTDMEVATFRLRGSHPLRQAFPDPSTTQRLSHSTPPQQRGHTPSHNPGCATPVSYHTHPV